MSLEVQRSGLQLRHVDEYLKVTQQLPQRVDIIYDVYKWRHNLQLPAPGNLYLKYHNSPIYILFISFLHSATLVNGVKCFYFFYEWTLICYIHSFWFKIVVSVHIFSSQLILSTMLSFGDIMVLASPPCPPVDPDDMNTLHEGRYPLRYIAMEIWHPPMTRTTAFAAKRHSYPPNLQNAISP